MEKMGCQLGEIILKTELTRSRVNFEIDRTKIEIDKG